MERAANRDSLLGQIWKLEYEGELQITTANPSILLIIQIFSNTTASGETLFRSRISRLDMLSVRPFTQSEEAAHEWFVLDDNFEVREFKASSLSKAIELTVRAIEERLRK